MHKDKDFLILAIDTSCDDTSVAITNGRSVIVNAVSSQIELHKKSGGVVPIDAARAHDIKLEPLINYALKKSKFSYKDLKAIAVTYGPGLAPALQIGIQKAKELSINLDIPLIPVNHMAGHIYANWAQTKNETQGIEENMPWPKLCLLLSGGHTELIFMKGHHEFKIVGETLDDACGECFDKVGRMIGLGYPAAPAMEVFAKSGDENKYNLPIPMKDTDDYNVSYSGLKTASFRLIKNLSEKGNDENKVKAPAGTEVFNLSKQEIYDLCASFQKAAFDTILNKLNKALKNIFVEQLLLGGGVVKNKTLRSRARKIANEQDILFHYPSEKLIRDNAAMIGVAGYYQYVVGKNILKTTQEKEILDRVPNLRLGD